MLKKLILSVFLILGAAGMFAQTIVSTTTENRKVILEEFTGVNCIYCPNGHVIANAIKDEYPDDFFIINIHAGGFATPNGGQPDFRTEDGEALRANWNVTSFPTGMVNRNIFSGGTPVQGVPTWASNTDILIVQDSYLNLAVESNIDVDTRELTIHVEAFYTADSPVASNFLSVALLQNRTLGPQTGGNSGNNYEHNHRLVDLITPAFGEEINTTTMGSFVDRNYTYTIPVSYTDIPALLEDMEIVVFMTETDEDIISGNGAKPTYTNVALANDVNLFELSEIPDLCSADATPTLTLRNMGQNTITSLDINYSINGGATETFTFNGNITTFELEDIEIPITGFTLNENNTIEFSVTNDEDNTNNTISTTFSRAPDTVGTVILNILTDTWAEELSWQFLDSNGTVLESETYSGNNNGTAGGDDNTEFQYVVDLPADCIEFRVVDAFGDGSNEGAGGFVELTDAEGVVLYEQNGNYGAGFNINFNSDGVVVLGTAEETFNTLSIYPNPAQGFFFVKNAEFADIEIYTTRGRLVRRISKVSKNEKIETNRMPAGVYFVNITKDGFTATEKLIVK